MSGGKSALWKDETMADVFTEKAVAFIEQNRARPFFLFFSTHDIHVPRVPHPRFVGKTTMGPRGDVIVQLDWCVGEVNKALDRLGLTENTIVIFTSDNGPVIDDGYKDDSVEKLGGHKPAGPLRGGKYSAFEAGTRVPFIVRWPAKIKPGTSDALVCQIDFLASFAKHLDRPLPSTSPDSVDVLDALLGVTTKGREYLVEQAGGAVLAVRHNNWKYIPPGQGRRVSLNTNTETGQDPAGQLYDLSTDPGEKNNLISQQRDRAAELAAYLRDVRGQAAPR
jgi:arylsulfatase A-like enzyme